MFPNKMILKIVVKEMTLGILLIKKRKPQIPTIQKLPLALKYEFRHTKIYIDIFWSMEVQGSKIDKGIPTPIISLKLYILTQAKWPSRVVMDVSNFWLNTNPNSRENVIFDKTLSFSNFISEEDRPRLLTNP